MKVAGYGRVSTTHQVKDGTSSEEQERLIEEECRKNCWDLVHFYSDDGYSGKNVLRPGYVQMLADAKQKKFNILVFTKLDRFGRSLRDILNTYSDLYDLGIEIHCINQPEINSKGIYGKLLVQLLGAFAEFERTMILERTQQGRRAKANKNAPACGRIPYGRVYDKQTGQWGVDPAKKARIEEIANLYIETDTNFEKLAKRYGMNQMNLRKILVKTDGSVFEMTFQNKKDDTKEVVSLSVPPLLHDDTMSKIRAKAEAKRKWDRPKRKYSYLLSSKVLDADTGYVLTGSHVAKTGRRFYYYYREGGRYSIDADTLENAVWKALVEALSDSKAMIKAVFEGEPEEKLVDTLNEKRSKKEHELTRVDQRIQNIARLVEFYDGNDLDSFLEQQRPKLTELFNNKEILTEEIEAITYQLKTIPSEAEIENRRQEIRNQLAKRQQKSYFTSGHTLNDLSLDERQRLINLVFGGRDFEGKRYGVYLRKGKDNRYTFTAYGVMGDYKGYVTARGGEYYSEPGYEIFLNDDKNVEITKKIAKEINLGIIPSEDKMAVALLREII